MLNELRQIGATKVNTPHCGTKPCIAMYQLFRNHQTHVSDERNDVIELLVGQSEWCLLCFTLTGEEHVDDPLGDCKNHGYACSFGSVARQQICKWGIPRFYEPTVHPGMCDSNVGVCTLMTAQVAELTQGTESDAKSLAVSNANVYSPASQLHLRKEIISRLPEHMRCVLPPEGDNKNKLSLTQLEDAVKLLLKYEDCFVGASIK